MLYLRDENGKPSATRMLFLMLMALLAFTIVEDLYFDKEVLDQPYGILQALMLAFIAALGTRTTVMHIVKRRTVEEDDEELQEDLDVSNPVGFAQHETWYDENGEEFPHEVD